eukprot:TRINITY_DN16069_c0_g1_i2.p1 TRINITY_DN16069_c0_g1~~TRINITY_DN16069_c0_g1_i2.p1  ORF type:complete len:846 (+),score=240.37 TRINITY_DN16069_c0_g1_i2:114-2651(+)
MEGAIVGCSAASSSRSASAPSSAYRAVAAGAALAGAGAALYWRSALRRRLRGLVVPEVASACAASRSQEEPPEAARAAQQPADSAADPEAGEVATQQQPASAAAAAEAAPEAAADPPVETAAEGAAAAAGRDSRAASTEQLGQSLPTRIQKVLDSERSMGLRTLLMALQACDRVSADSILGPFQVSSGEEEVPVVIFQFRMSHFTCKAYLGNGGQDEGSQHLKLQTIFEDNRRAIGEEQRYYVANEWNSTKKYTRLICGSGGGSSGHSSAFMLEYHVLVPGEATHSYGMAFLAQTLKMWYTSMVACVMFIVAPRDMPFATHEMISANTVAETVREEDTAVLKEACPICFECFHAGDRVRRLPCLHVFHVSSGDKDGNQCHNECNIDRHLTCDKQCPVCKTPIDIMDRLTRDESGRKVQAYGGIENITTAITGAASSAPQSQAAVAGPAAAAAAGEAPAAGHGGAPPAAQVGADEAQAAAAPGSAADEAARAAGARSAAGGEDGRSSEGTVGQIYVSTTTGPPAPHRVPGDARRGPGPQGSPPSLPAQAAELEQAVSSLQSRWMQIQDVVAGMQQMLQIIEESQSVITAARAEENRRLAEEAANGEAAAPDAAAEGAESPERAPPASGAPEEPTAEPVAEVMIVEEALATEAAANRAAAEAAAEAARSARAALTSPPPLAAEAAADTPQEATQSPVDGSEATTQAASEVASESIPTSDAAVAGEGATTGSGLTTSSVRESGSQAAEELPEVQEQRRASAAEAPPEEGRHEEDVAARPEETSSSHSSQRRGSSSPSGRPSSPGPPPPPFSEAEKVCMAYLWQQRQRAAQPEIQSTGSGSERGGCTSS